VVRRVGGGVAADHGVHGALYALEDPQAQGFQIAEAAFQQYGVRSRLVGRQIIGIDLGNVRPEPDFLQQEILLRGRARPKALPRTDRGNSRLQIRAEHLKAETLLDLGRVDAVAEVQGLALLVDKGFDDLMAEDPRRRQTQGGLQKAPAAADMRLRQGSARPRSPIAASSPVRITMSMTLPCVPIDGEGEKPSHDALASSVWLAIVPRCRPPR
jgi:hypothetical protein